MLFILEQDLLNILESYNSFDLSSLNSLINLSFDKSQKIFSSSIPTYFLLFFTQETPVVPLPLKGSRTVSFSSVEALIIKSKS